MPASTNRRCRALVVALGLCAAEQAIAQPAPSQRLADLSLEDLGQLQITSVSKRAERLADAPTSVFVITAADIRRSGATSLPEALRLAPNLQVVRVSAFEYTASARGFNSESANKLLVMIDGRSVYTPLFSGVFWDVQDTLLEDIERIEVISGPGSTLWGVNAVNGVINVITRHAADTAGSLVSASAGPQESRASARFGKAGDGLSWRVFGTRRDLKDTETEAGTRVDDAGHITHAGGQADFAQGDDRVMLQAAWYQGSREQPLPGSIHLDGVEIPFGPISVAGGHLLGRWDRRLADGGALHWQAYVDRTERTVVPTFADTQTTVDLQFQHSPAPIGPHRLVWGLNWRHGDNHVRSGEYVAFLPARQRQDWASVFVQDEVTLDDGLRLTLGARAGYNYYTGTELMPTLRLAWKWAPDQLLWATATRTVRAPSRLDRDTYVPSSPPFLLRGGPGVDSEVADVVELGYRGQPMRGVSLSATAYHADYDRLRTQEVDPSFTYAYFANGMAGRVRGVEAWGSWQASPRWRLHFGANRLIQSLRLRSGSNAFGTVDATEGDNPAWWWALRSSLDIAEAVDLDASLRQVAALPARDLPRYTTLDLRLAWRPGPGLELSLGGLNLLGDGHAEFSDPATRSHWGRTWRAGVDWRF
ncbi:MAG: TonB-dependent receptor plug domain-containing protein [Pseudomonadota bacterium]